MEYKTGDMFLEALKTGHCNYARFGWRLMLKIRRVPLYHCNMYWRLHRALQTGTAFQRLSRPVILFFNSQHTKGYTGFQNKKNERSAQQKYNNVQCFNRPTCSISRMLIIAYYLLSSSTEHVSPSIVYWRPIVLCCILKLILFRKEIL